VRSIGTDIKKTAGNETGELCIQFAVDKKLSPEAIDAAVTRFLPSKVQLDNGLFVKTDIVENAAYLNHTIIGAGQRSGIVEPRKGKSDPLRPGISVSSSSGVPGTVGAIVELPTGDTKFILSCAHILYDHLGDKSVYQPALDDGGTIGDSRIGELVGWYIGAKGDMALAKVEARITSNSILDLNVQPKRIAAVEIGDILVKSGRTTGVTYGIVRDTNRWFSVPYPSVGTKTLTNCIYIEIDPARQPADGEISQTGDSGSLWMIYDGGYTDIAVGMHTLGETASGLENEYAIAMPILPIMNHFNIRFS
jgi:endonuclease G, mitochondrial